MKLLAPIRTVSISLTCFAAPIHPPCPYIAPPKDPASCTVANVPVSGNSSRLPMSSNFASTPLVAPPPATLRQQVERVAAQRGHVFHPIPNRFREGQQVYRLGSQQVFFDRNVSYVYNLVDDTWNPITFAELLSAAAGAK